MTTRSPRVRVAAAALTVVAVCTACSTGTSGEVVAVTAQMRELMSGNDPWVYSAAHQRRDPDELRASLGLRRDSPVVVALLSSPDETRSSMLVDAEYHRDPERGRRWRLG